jgi:hypothetical protein
MVVYTRKKRQVFNLTDDQTFNEAQEADSGPKTLKPCEEEEKNKMLQKIADYYREKVFNDDAFSISLEKYTIVVT